MKAYIAIKFYRDFRNKQIVEQLTKVLEKKGYETICLIRDDEKEGKVKFSPKELMELAFRRIDSCQLVIVEFSEKGVGLGIEAGYAYAKGIPVITIAKKGSDVSETLKGISKKVIIYDDIDIIEL